jgi:hypothetical protein
VAKMKWREDRLTGDWIQFWAFLGLLHGEQMCLFVSDYFSLFYSSGHESVSHWKLISIERCLMRYF